MFILWLLVGLALLLFGRRLYWVFVGGVGFVFGFYLGARLFEGQTYWVVLLVALAVGLLGALLASFLQSLAIGVAGFLAGGVILMSLLDFFMRHQGTLSWVFFIIGGVVGAVLVAVLFDWALIILSSFVGASFIVQNIPAHLSPFIGGLLMLVLLLLGIAVQGSLYHHAASEDII